MKNIGNMKNLFTIILLFIVVNVFAQNEEVQETQYLFVQNSESVSFSDGKLTLNHISPTTMFFTDRPARMAGHMTTPDFVEDWDEGENSFAEDPPNAVISIFGKDEILDIVITIRNPKLKGDNLVYDIDILDGVLPSSGNECSLFIDPVGRPASPTSAAGVHRRHTRRHVAAATH